MKKNLMLYIHIPFCVKKCAYCDFLSAPADAGEREKYGENLLEEIESAAGFLQSREITSVYVGGGTPSLLMPSFYEELFHLLDHHFGFSWREGEITLEANPGTLTPEHLSGYRRAGFNRLSIGLQSAHREELKTLGRIHDWQTFLDNYRAARQAGFSNINVDVMSAIPGQTLQSYQKTLEQVIEIAPEHISSYSLILEEGTSFYRDYVSEPKSGLPKLPDEDTDREMYELTGRLLEQAGYFRYEISNYAQKGYEAKHNQGYWKLHEYIGFGLGASSYMEGMRFRVVSFMPDYQNYVSNMKTCKNLKAWINLHEDVEQIDRFMSMSEMMFLGLRMCEGVSEDEFFERFHEKIEHVYPDVIEKYMKSGHLCKENGRIFLSKKGMDVCNVIMSEFV